MEEICRYKKRRLRFARPPCFDVLFFTVPFFKPSKAFHLNVKAFGVFSPDSVFMLG